MFLGGCKCVWEFVKDCLCWEIREELFKLKFGRISFWKEVKVRNKCFGCKMNDVIFIVEIVKGRLVIGDKKEIDCVVW